MWIDKMDRLSLSVAPNHSFFTWMRMENHKEKFKGKEWKNNIYRV